MGAPQSNLPQHLRTFVEPQIEQFSLRMECVRCGLYATLPESLGEGFLWTAALGEDCLISMHSLRLKKPFVLEERPTDFSCIFSGSRATLQSMPNVPAEAPAERENLAAFSQAGGTTRCLLQEGVLYESTSITYTPGYFDGMRKRFPRRFQGRRSGDPRGRRREPSRRDALHPEIVYPRAGVAARSRAVLPREGARSGYRPFRPARP